MDKTTYTATASNGEILTRTTTRKVEFFAWAPADGPGVWVTSATAEGARKNLASYGWPGIEVIPAAVVA